MGYVSELKVTDWLIDMKIIDTDICELWNEWINDSAVI